MVYEVRARGVSIALRRLTDLAASVDGRFPEETPRGKINRELERLSDEVLFSARRMTKERKEFDSQATAWQAMFAATLDAMFVLSAAGKVKELNPAAERQFRITAAEAVGSHLADLLFPLPHRALDNAAFMQDIAAGKAVGRRQELIVHCGQRQFPVEMAIAEFHVGDELGLIVTARDISAHRQTRADLKRVREQADRLQSRLRSELASRRLVRPTVESMTQVETAVAAPTGGTPFTLEDACGDVIRKLVVKAERKGLGFRYEDTEVQGMGLIGDASRLRTVASELIENVIRNAPTGEIIVHFSALSTDERSIELVVSVTATAMTDEQSTQVGRPLNLPAKAASRSKPRAGREAQRAHDRRRGRRDAGRCDTGPGCGVQGAHALRSRSVARGHRSRCAGRGVGPRNGLGRCGPTPAGGVRAGGGAIASQRRQGQPGCALGAGTPPEGDLAADRAACPRPAWSARWRIPHAAAMARTPACWRVVWQRRSTRPCASR